MAPTPKIKLLRVLSVLQCWVALWILVLGIVEHVRGSWIHTGLGLAIWTSVWVGFTGAFGVFIAFKQVQITSRGSFIPSHLVMSFMGFSLTCGILSTLYLFLYSQEMSISAAKELRQFTYVYERSGENIIARKVAKPISFNPKENEDHALVGSIFGFMVVELILSMWSVGVSLAGDNFKILSEDENGGDALMTPTGQDQNSRIVTGGFGFPSNA